METQALVAPWSPLRGARCQRGKVPVLLALVSTQTPVRLCHRASRGLGFSQGKSPSPCIKRGRPAICRQMLWFPPVRSSSAGLGWKPVLHVPETSGSLRAVAYLQVKEWSVRTQDCFPRHHHPTEPDERVRVHWESQAGCGCLSGMVCPDPGKESWPVLPCLKPFPLPNTFYPQ